MRRREFIGLLGSAVAAWPLSVRAQQGEGVRRIGVLMARKTDDAEGQKQFAAPRRPRRTAEPRSARLIYGAMASPGRGRSPYSVPWKRRMPASQRSRSWALRSM